jgi:hypothetical protein
MWKRSLFRSFFLNFTVLIILKAVAVQILELATAPFLSHDGNQSSRGTLTKLSFWAISMMSAGESSYVVISTM